MQSLPMSEARALVSPPNSITSPISTPELSKPLASWLLDEASDDRAVGVIAKSDILRSEAAMSLPALRQAAMRPATQEEIKGIIGSRFATYPQPQRTVGEAAAFWADYFDALAELPASFVEAGMAAHVRDPQSEFLPKPGRLAELARTAPNEGRWFKALRRARRACEQARDHSGEPTKKIDRPSAEEMKAIMADFHARMAAKAPPPPSKLRPLPPSPCAPVDDRGVSEPMRALLARTAR